MKYLDTKGKLNIEQCDRHLFLPSLQICSLLVSERLLLLSGFHHSLLWFLLSFFFLITSYLLESCLMGWWVGGINIEACLWLLSLSCIYVRADIQTSLLCKFYFSVYVTWNILDMYHVVYLCDLLLYLFIIIIVKQEGLTIVDSEGN